MGRLPAGVLNAISRTCIILMPFDILISLFLSLLSFQSWRSHINILGAVGDDGIFQHHPAQVGKLGTHLSLFLFPVGEVAASQFNTTLCCLGQGVALAMFFLCSPLFSNSFSFASMGCWALFARNPGFLQRLLLSAYVSTVQVSSTGAKGAGSQAPTGSITHSKVCFSITQCTGRQDSS